MEVLIPNQDSPLNIAYSNPYKKVMASHFLNEVISVIQFYCAAENAC